MARDPGATARGGGAEVLLVNDAYEDEQAEPLGSFTKTMAEQG